MAAQPWGTPAPVTEGRTAMVAAVTEAVLDSMDAARTGADLTLLLSDALSIQLPHDRLELIAVAPAPECWALPSIDGLAGRKPTLDHLDQDRIDAMVHRIGAAEWHRFEDIRVHELEWPGPVDRHGADRVAGLAMARMEVGGELVGWLMAGSESADWYSDADGEVLRLAARLIAPRVAAWAARQELAGAW
jgi:hypothetical protein